MCNDVLFYGSMAFEPCSQPSKLDDDADADADAIDIIINPIHSLDHPTASPGDLRLRPNHMAARWPSLESL